MKISNYFLFFLITQNLLISATDSNGLRNSTLITTPEKLSLALDNFLRDPIWRFLNAASDDNVEKLANLSSRELLNRGGDRALKNAAFFGSSKALCYLLDKGINVNTRVDNETALTWAIISHNEEQELAQLPSKGKAIKEYFALLNNSQQ